MRQVKDPLASDKFVKLIVLDKNVDGLLRKSKKVRKDMANIGARVHIEYEKMIANEPRLRQVMEEAGIK